MTITRFWHTATLLTSGKVLIAGGDWGLNGLNTAEIYDPGTGTFTLTGSMTTPRFDHTATLLPDGRVLIAGGSSGPDVSPLASTETYDPSTGTFSAAGNMIFGHACHEATLLGNSKVLITGGAAVGVLPYGPELFDPATGTFAPAGAYASRASSLNTCQESVSTLLPDGRVLIVWEGSGAELYDPVAGSFTPTGTSIGNCYCDGMPTATLLLNGKVLAAGGEDDTGIHATAELYGPSMGTFTATGSLTTPRVGQTATVLPDGSVLMAGTDDFLYTSYVYPSLASSEVYDPISGAFTPTGDMTVPRGFGHTATLLNNGQVLIAGGGADASTAELYNPRVLVSAPALFPAAGSGPGQGAIWHAATGQVASANNPASAGEALSMYTQNLGNGGVIPPQVAVGGRLAEVLFFGDAPGYPGYFQVNFRVPTGITPGPAIPGAADLSQQAEQ